MNKTEFIDGLGKSLKGKVDENEYRKQIEYYSSYISREVANGKKEEDVIDELGDPRLIAKTIVNTYIMRDNPINAGYKENTRYNYQTEENDNYEKSNAQNDNPALKRMLYTIFAIAIVLCIVIFVLRMFIVLIPLIGLFMIAFAVIRFINSR